MVFPKKSILLFLGDIGIITIAYVLSSAIWIGTIGKTNSIAPETVVLFLVSYPFTFYLIDFYNCQVNFELPNYLLKHLTGFTTATGVLATTFYLFPELKSGRGIFLLTTLLTGAGTYLWRRAYQLFFQANLIRPQNLLIIGAGKAGTMLYQIMRNNTDYKVIGIMTDDGRPVWGLNQIPTITDALTTLKQVIKAQQVNTLVLALSNFKDPKILKAALDCKLDGVSIYDMPSFYEKVTGKVPVEHVTDFWLVFTPLLGVKKNAYNQKLKRAADVILSFFGLVFTLPLTLAISAAVKFESPGPILFKQKRVGLNGKAFTVFKFRSMRTGADHDRQFAGEKDDPRITRVGKFIRLSRMDEIPQMWNVLKGDMSFIGPRALIEDEVNEFESKIPYFSLRNWVRPGITGWAQINYRHGVSVEDGLEKLQYDLFYIKNLSPFLDFHILLKTVKVVLSGKGAR